jgi:hypothetical protein
MSKIRKVFTLPKLAPDPFGFALPLERVIPLLVIIGLTVFNLQFETKDKASAKAAKWSLAAMQFILIILLLFQNNTYLLLATLAFGLLSIIPAYFRFEDHENVRLSYLITQGLVALVFLGLMLYHIRDNRKRLALLQEAATYDAYKSDERSYRDSSIALGKKIDAATARNDSEEAQRLTSEQRDADLNVVEVTKEIQKIEQKYNNAPPPLSKYKPGSSDANSGNFEIIDSTEFKAQEDDEGSGDGTEQTIVGGTSKPESKKDSGTIVGGTSKPESKKDSRTVMTKNQKKRLRQKQAARNSK